MRLKYRMLNGQNYKLDRSVQTKDNAQYYANRLRKQGRLVRVVKATKTETIEDGSRWHIFVK